MLLTKRRKAFRIKGFRRFAYLAAPRRVKRR
nr:MAG TPA: hypothetical protein [Caudoviricetes sp.]